MYTLKAVFFDHTTIIKNDGSLHLGIHKAISDIKAIGLKIGVLSTHYRPFGHEVEFLGLDKPDYYFHQGDIGSNKGTSAWFEKICESTGLAPQELLYVGDDELDWRTALQGGVIYLHGSWSKPKPKKPVIPAPTPSRIFQFATHFLLTPPRWQFEMDVPEYDLSVRSLMYAYTRLPATTKERFLPHDVFHQEDENIPEIKNVDALVGEMLVLHALTSLHLEGLLEYKSYFTIYPSSQIGSKNIVLEKFIEVSSKLFWGYYKSDLIERVHSALDTSQERSIAKKQNRIFNPTFRIQSDSTRINPSSIQSIKGKNIILFDDFLTTGTSLEWGRNLLLAAGAKKVILVSIGKYRTPYKLHILNPERSIIPTVVKTYERDIFSIKQLRMKESDSARRLLAELFRAWKNDLPYIPDEYDEDEFDSFFSP